MTNPTPIWLRHRWKLFTGLLVLVAVCAAVVAVFAWKRVGDTDVNNHLNRDASDSAPKLVLSQYSLPVNAMTYSPDGRQFATAAIDMSPGNNKRGEIRIWDVAIWREQRGCQGFSGSVASLAFSPDGKMLVSGGAHVMTAAAGSGSRFKVSGEAKVWNLSTDANPSLLQKSDKVILSVVFSPQGDRLAVSCEDGTITLYNPATNQQELSLRSDAGVSLSSNMAFSADGKQLVSVGIKSPVGHKDRFKSFLQVWDAVAAKPLTTLQPPEIPKEISLIKSVAFLPAIPGEIR